MRAPGMMLPTIMAIPPLIPMVASAESATKLAPWTTGSLMPRPVWISVARPAVRKQIWISWLVPAVSRPSIEARTMGQT